MTIKDGYLYVIGGFATEDWEEYEYFPDVWRAYIGGSDIDFSSSGSDYMPPTLTVTNNSENPVKELYIYPANAENIGHNWIASNLAVFDSETFMLDEGLYAVYVKDTQNRYQTSSVLTVDNPGASWVISSGGWTSPPAPQSSPQYSYTIKNNHDYNISAVYIRKTGTSAWGSSRGKIDKGAQLVVSSLDAGTYDIEIASTLGVKTSAGTNAAKRTPNIAGGLTNTALKNVPAYCYFEGNRLTGNKTLTISAKSSWTSVSK